MSSSSSGTFKDLLASTTHLCEHASHSMQTNLMSLPPWRTAEFQTGTFVKRARCITLEPHGPHRVPVTRHPPVPSSTTGLFSFVLTSGECPQESKACCIIPCAPVSRVRPQPSADILWFWDAGFWSIIPRHISIVQTWGVAATRGVVIHRISHERGKHVG